MYKYTLYAVKIFDRIKLRNRETDVCRSLKILMEKAEAAVLCGCFAG